MTASALPSARRALAALGALLVLTGTAACGSDDDAAGSTAGGAGSSAGSGSSDDAAADEAGSYPLPDGFPLDSFPVPPGAGTGDAGSTAEDSVSILITDVPADEVLTYYSDELAASGYELMPDLEDGALSFSGNGVEGAVIAPGGDGGIVSVSIS